ncbi:hypothetical protein, conserved [Babesia ovata]|uniref:6-Cys domain-containing protein n=1 Tax=Babesia ovata TaxID=189622 RepID=A0A2H6K6X6_9APIC|nr:uncharacterized protein BOVATA_002500 [Babesia ovata]GBE58757.1 hypothetical protein, conserved [Babesia ovata]
MIAITENRLIFICGPRNLVLSDALQRHIYHFSFTQPRILPWAPSTPLTQEIAKIGSGLGVLFLNRGRLHMPLQGCGGRPSPLFSPDNEVTVDPVTGIRSCVVDPMSESPIGFLCEGKIEPKECMKFLLDENGRVITAPPPHSYWDIQNDGHFVVAKYFDQLPLPPISGKCRCIDPETGQVKAKIEIRSKTDYICDITSMIERNTSQPIRGPWCSVVLQPGSTLTIRFPAEDVNTEPSEKDSPPGMPPQKRPKYVFDTGFMPKDLATLRQLASVYGFDIYDQISYHDAISGDALQLDVSQMGRGEVNLSYHADKPMALLHGTNSFYYHWTFISGDKNVAKKIRATINVAFAFTHHYRTIGCDRGTPSVFDPDISQKHCSAKSMGNGIGDVYECKAHIKEGFRQAGIYCRPDEELLPHNCESMGYDLHKNRIISIPGSLRNATTCPSQGFQLFDYFFRDYSPVSYACFCVDQRGYEKSRLIVTSHHHEKFTYMVNREKASYTLIPYVLLPWREVGLSKRQISPKSIMLNNISQESVFLQVGRTLFLTCGIAADGSSNCDCINHCIDEDFPAKWLPSQLEEFYYSVNETSDAIELVKTAYVDTIATTPGGLIFGYHNEENGTQCSTLVIQSTMDAILISKNPIHQQYVPMAFVCGKTPEPSDLSVTTRNVSASNAHPHRLSKVMGLSIGYTWYVVQVNVQTTDPHMQGCGVTYESTDLFKPETPQLYDADGRLQFGCNIDLNAAKETAFYCPAPYVLDPPNCFSQVYVDGEVRNTRDISESLVASRSNHFVILSLDSSLVGPGETLRQTPPLECRCVTTKGVVLSTIQIENYYSKW